LGGRDPAIDHDLAVIPSVDAVDQSQQLAATGPDEPGDAQHLARAKLEGGVLHVGQATHAPYLQDDLVAAGRTLGEQLLELSADHELDQVIRRGARGQAGRDRRTLAQHGHPVADASDLVESMRDVDHADAFISEASDDVEEGLDLVVVEDRRGLVHDEEADAVRQGPCDRDDLLSRRPK
jgi:hypothetical protein